jgi:hypothetical protein
LYEPVTESQKDAIRERVATAYKKLSETRLSGGTIWEGNITLLENIVKEVDNDIYRMPGLDKKLTHLSYAIFLRDVQNKNRDGRNHENGLAEIFQIRRFKRKNTSLCRLE